MWRIAVLLAGAVGADGGVIYECAPQSLDWMSRLACTQIDSAGEHIYIRPCLDPSQACPSTPPTLGAETFCAPGTYFTPSATTYGGLPGDPCRTNSDCKQANSVCGAGYCTGVASSQHCDSDLECLPGLYCDSGAGLCADQVETGKDCSRDGQCGMNAGCNNGVCTGLYTLSIGMKAEDCGSIGQRFVGMPVGTSAGVNYSVFCESATCGTDSTCVPAIKSQGQLPAVCTGKTTDCLTSNGHNLSSQTSCVAEVTSDGESHCQADIGDPPFLEFIQWVNSTFLPAVSTPTQYCHTSYRGVYPQCLLRLGGQYLLNQFLTVSQFAQNFANLAAADLCTLQVFYRQYYAPLQDNQFCDTKFQCDQIVTNSNTCVSEDIGSGTFTLTPCTDSLASECPAPPYWTSSSPPTVNCTTPFHLTWASNLYPGDYCQADWQCLSGNCTYMGEGELTVCAGQMFGDECQNDGDCDVGMYCDAQGSPSLCTKLKEDGASCTDPQQCQFTSSCNINPATSSGVCIPYFSVADGIIVSDCGKPSAFIAGSSPALAYSALCKSVTCELATGTTMEGVGTCVPAYRSSSLPSNCNFQPTDCPISSEDQGLANTQCQCAMTSTGERHCAAEVGDPPYQLLLQWTGQYLANFSTFNPSACHTDRRGFDQTCMMKVGGIPLLMQFLELYYNATSYADIINAENCTLQVYFPKYWAAYAYNHPYSVEKQAAWLGLAVAVWIVGN